MINNATGTNHSVSLRDPSSADLTKVSRHLDKLTNPTRVVKWTLCPEDTINATKKEKI